MGIVDAPGYRKIHSRPIPRIGGVVISLSVLLLFYLFSEESLFFYGFICSGSIILLFGFLDDCYSINYKYKFLSQLVASILFINVSGNYIPFVEKIFNIQFLYIDIILTSVFLVGTINIINLSDGLDALASGLSLLSYVFIGFMAYQNHQSHMVVISILMIASILAFMRFNVFPARIFMGDTGSQFLGFTLGICIVTLSFGKDHSALNIGLIPFLLGTPLIDTLNVIRVRASKHKNPFLPDKNHIHHKLIALGLPQYQAVVYIYLAHFFLLSLGLTLKNCDPLWLLSIYVSIVLFVFCLRNIRIPDLFKLCLSYLNSLFFVNSYFRSSFFISRQAISKFFWNVFFVTLSLYYIYFSLVLENIGFDYFIYLFLFLLALMIPFILFDKNNISFIKTVFYFLNIILLIYSNDTIIFEFGNDLLRLSLIDLSIIVVCFLYVFCIILTSEKLPINSIDVLLILGSVFFIALSRFESNFLYYLRFTLKLILMSFFVNLIFSRFQRNVKYVTFIMFFLVLVFIFKTIVL